LNQINRLAIRIDGWRLVAKYKAGHRCFAGCRLSGVDLGGAKLKDIDLRAADPNRANLRGADLLGTRLVQPDLSGAVVAPEQLAQAGGLRGATMPDSTEHE